MQPDSIVVKSFTGMLINWMYFGCEGRFILWGKIILKGLKNNKALGADSMANKFLKCGCYKARNKFLKTGNMIISTYRL